MNEETELSMQELKLQLDGNSVDWFLQNLVEIANSGSIEVGVTLYMQGSIISGLLVSGKKYFAAVAQQFYDAYPGSIESKEMMRDAFERNGDLYGKEKEPGAGSSAQFIHLIDARCFAHGADPIPSNETVAWRGRINAVSGFTIGQLKAEAGQLHD